VTVDAVLDVYNFTVGRERRSIDNSGSNVTTRQLGGGATSRGVECDAGWITNRTLGSAGLVALLNDTLDDYECRHHPVRQHRYADAERPRDHRRTITDNGTIDVPAPARSTDAGSTTHRDGRAVLTLDTGTLSGDYFHDNSSMQL